MRHFFNSELADLAAVAARLDARMEDDGEDSATALADGLAQFFEAEHPGAESGEDDSDSSVGSRGEIISTADDGASTDDDESDESPDEGEADDDEQEGESDDDESTDEDEDEDDEEEEDDTDEEEEPDDEPVRPAARGTLPRDIEQALKAVPKEQRTQIRETLLRKTRAMDASYTRAMQETRAERRAHLTAKTELDWVQENPVDFIFEMFDKNPALAEKFNEELENREHVGYRKEKGLAVKRQREEFGKKVDTQLAERDAEAKKVADRGNAVERIARSVAKAEGVKYEGNVERMLVEFLSNNDMKANMAMTDEAVKALVKGFARSSKSRARSDRQEYVRTKVKERNEGKKRVTPRDRGAVPAPGRRDDSKLTLEQKMLASAKRIAPDMPEG